MQALKYIFSLGYYLIVSLGGLNYQANSNADIHAFNLDGLLEIPDDTIKDDTIKYKKSRIPTFSPYDRRGDPYSRNTDLRRLIYGEPSNATIEYDSTNGGEFVVDEKIGNTDYRPPTVISRREMDEILFNESEDEYWKEGAGTDNPNDTLGYRQLIPRINLPENNFTTRVFGGDYIEFKPTGFANMDFGIQRQKVANPTLPIRQQTNTNFNFEPHVNLNLSGQVGTRLKITGSFDTQASFDFENQFKVEYTGEDYQIIRKIDFGNVNFPLPTTLIQGGQNLFGVSTHLQFGKLSVKAVYSNQRARAEQIVLDGQGGAQKRNFEIRADNYDVNRHFFLSHFFRDNYENNLRTLPVILSGVTITRVEVYVTNRVNNTQTLRNVAGFTNLGESETDQMVNPTNATYAPISPGAARNESNGLFDKIVGDANVRQADNASSTLQSTYGLQNGDDYTVLRAARKLNDNEFSFQPELGYISLLTPLRNDEVLAVAYEYTLNGQTYKVGELTEDYQSRDDSDVIYLKLLRPPAIRLDLPNWDLMMKNVYQLGTGQVNQTNFQLRIIYRDDITGLDNPSLQEGTQTRDVQLLRLFNLDNLNQQQDPQPDGNFDFVENVTINSRNGTIIFPILEPFGSFLESQFSPVTEASLIDRYVFNDLYESTFADALQDAGKNKFFIKGNYETTASSDVNLNGLNIAEGSVRVSAGNTVLVEGTDYTVNYQTGQVQIINEAILNSGREVTIDYEQADLFNFQVRRLFGTRLDYQYSPNLNIGATFMNLTERPVITRNNAGNEPTSNSIWGFDVTYNDESRFLTRLVDKIPLIDTKEKSTVSFYGEFAQLIPGASPLSGQVSYIDDFEGTRNSINLTRTPHVNWKLGSTPQLFPQATPDDPLQASYRRARLAWYNIDNVFYQDGGRNRPDNIGQADLDNHYIRQVIPQEIFRNRQQFQLNTNEVIFDMAFYPNERGPYNYSTDLDANGNLNNPEENWGAITRAFTTDIDFDNANVEYIEFWMLDPFINGENGRVLDGQFNERNTTGGKLFINLGNVSEDVMVDGRHMFENGLPVTGADEVTADQGPWGFVPRQQYLTDAFDNDAGTRGNQDVGWDGLRNDQEAGFFQNYLNNLPANLTAEARAAIEADPSADNFAYYLGGDRDANDEKILERYKQFNNYDGNSPISSNTGTFTASATNNPDNEDLNNDNTLNELEGYYQYEIDLQPGNLAVGSSEYIIDQVDADINGETVNWYLFRIPIRQFDQQVGNINGFKSIRFIRMFMTGWRQPVVLRMAQMQMVANSWRRFEGNLALNDFNTPNEPDDPDFTVAVVNIEENGVASDGGIPYTLPPGSIRDQDVSSVNQRQLNEQSMQLSVINLQDKDARAVFKTQVFDLLSYKNLNMFIHAESRDGSVRRDGEVTAFVRLGTDFTQNYYEVEVPLEMTPLGTTNPRDIWPLNNEINIPLEALVGTKIERNTQNPNQNIFLPYSRQVNQYNVTVVGNPDLSSVQTAMIGIRNPDLGPEDDQLPKSFLIWANELRLTGYDQTAGWAALGRLNAQLADFADVSSSVRYTTFGFGSINDKISDRARETTLEYDIAANIALGKFLPENWGIEIPLYVSYEKRRIIPRFNPLDPDVTLQTYLDNLETDEEREDFRRLVEDRTTRRSFNFTNVRKRKINTERPSRLWDISNFSFTYAYSEEQKSNVNIASYLKTTQQLSLNYNYTSQSKGFSPFKNIGFLDSPYLQLIKDFNFNLMPSSILVQFDLNRTFAKTQLRSSDLTTNGISPLYEKNFTFNRLYDVQWNLTQNITLNYSANAQAIIDEPFGDLDTEEKRDSVLNNVLNFGRMKNFSQQVGLNYNIPLDKIPFTNYLNASLAYNVGYNWQAGSLLTADSLGNTINNTRQRSANGRIDMVKLYKKLKFLKKVEEPAKPVSKDDTTSKRDNFNIVRAFVRPLLMVRSINLTYSVNEQTSMAGFMPQPYLFGLDSSFAAPGIDFILGSQSQSIKETAAENGWLSQSTFLNTPFSQSFQENLSLRATLEPFKDFRITLDATRRRTSGYQEIFRYNPDTDSYETLNPIRTGSHTVSFISLRTAFGDTENAENISKTFQELQDNRQIILDRLNAENPNAGEYGLNSQDVLIPAFLAAYGGQDVNKVGLSPFPAIPLPNWRLDYSGLSKLEFIKSLFSSFTLTHAYTSSYTVGSFTSSLEYGAAFVELNSPLGKYQAPDRVNENNEFIPINVINQVSIAERFSPLIGINLRTTNNITLRADYNRERNLTLNLSNTELTETQSQNIVIGLGYTTRNLKLPFKNRQGKQTVLTNDINFRVDVTVRDTETIQRKLDDVNTITAGNINIQIKPTISYVANRRLNILIYYERNVNQPKVSSSFPRTNTTFGFQLRYNLAQ